VLSWPAYKNVAHKWPIGGFNKSDQVMISAELPPGKVRGGEIDTLPLSSPHSSQLRFIYPSHPRRYRYVYTEPTKNPFIIYLNTFGVTELCSGPKIIENPGSGLFPQPRMMNILGGSTPLSAPE
jgi:hypothetical protein